jgi:Type II intron maturase
VQSSDCGRFAKYASEYRGLVQYYLLAQDVFRLERLRGVTETSMLKTLAGKHRSTVNKMAAKYKTVIDTAEGKRTCFQVLVHRDHGRKPLVAQFGGIPLKRQRTAISVRSVTDHRQHQTQRTDSPAAGRALRDLRVYRQARSPPPAQIRRPSPPRPT